MAEANGYILVKAPSEINSAIKNSQGDISWETMLQLFAFSGIPESEVSNTTFESHKGSSFPHEGITEHQDFIEITVFGEVWMSAMKDLVQNGKNVQVYGVVWHEYGITDYYALNDRGEYSVGVYEEENGNPDASEVTEEEVADRWVNTIPKEVKEMFPKRFGSS
ncbi:MAG: hypothetical protein HRU20_25335 [Pseudomonadales bacterium]|nr:hypothetical protein [Pseudomonadales bacterium]